MIFLDKADSAELRRSLGPGSSVVLTNSKVLDSALMSKSLSSGAVNFLIQKMGEAASERRPLTFAPESRGLENLIESGSQLIHELPLWV